MVLEHAKDLKEDVGAIAIFPELDNFLESIDYSGQDRPTTPVRLPIHCCIAPAEMKNLASVGQMVCFVAHEMRNPLQNIQLGVDIMRMKLTQGDKDKLEVLEQIESGIDALDGMVKDLLNYSQPVLLRPAATTMSELVAKSLLTLRNRFGWTCVHLELQDSEQEISLDAERIARLLINLIQNALEAMPDDGKLRIGSRFTHLAGANAVEITVSDNGVGIAKADLERIQQPFVTTKATGVGLGIPICKKIVEAHCGTFHIMSRIGKGTTVTVTLPLTHSAQVKTKSRQDLGA